MIAESWFLYQNVPNRKTKSLLFYFFHFRPTTKVIADLVFILVWKGCQTGAPWRSHDEPGHSSASQIWYPSLKALFSITLKISTVYHFARARQCRKFHCWSWSLEWYREVQKLSSWKLSRFAKNFRGFRNPRFWPRSENFRGFRK